MKSILSTSLALVLLAPGAIAEDKKKSNKQTRSTRTSTKVTNVNGKTEGTVTVTIDNNGKTETKTWKIDTPYTKIQDKPVVVKAQKHKKERVTWLGVAVTEVSDDLRTQLDIPDGSGVRVRQAVHNSPAAKAGLRADDLIVRIGEQIIFTIPQFQALMRSYKSGTDVDVTFYRKGKKQTVTAKLNTHEIFTQIKQPGTELKQPPEFNLAPTTLSRILSSPSMITQYQSHIDPNTVQWRKLQSDADKTTAEARKRVLQWNGPKNTRALIVRPDGKTTIVKSPEQIHSEVRKSIESSLKKSNLPEHALKSALKAIDQAFKAQSKN